MEALKAGVISLLILSFIFAALYLVYWEFLDLFQEKIDLGSLYQGEPESFLILVTYIKGCQSCEKIIGDLKEIKKKYNLDYDILGIWNREFQTYLPEIIIVDNKGKVLKRIKGVVELNFLEEEIKSLYGI